MVKGRLGSDRSRNESCVTRRLVVVTQFQPDVPRWSSGRDVLYYRISQETEVLGTEN